jgi:hypothetical protein
MGDDRRKRSMRNKGEGLEKSIGLGVYIPNAITSSRILKAQSIIYFLAGIGAYFSPNYDTL